MNVKKPTLAMKDTAAEPPATNSTSRDLKTHQPMFYRPEGFVLEIDGKFKSDYKTSADAMKAGLSFEEEISIHSGDRLCRKRENPHTGDIARVT